MRPPGERQRGTVRLLALGGLLAAAGDVGLPIWVATLRPGYDHGAQYMSELGAPGAPGATLLSAWWVVSGLLLAGLGLGLHRGTAGHRWLGPALVAGYGVFTGIGSGLFPCDPGCVGRTPTAQAHEHLNVVGAFCQLLAPAACWLRWRTTESAWAFRTGTLVAQAVLLLAFVLFLAVGETTHGQPGSVAGLTQRLYQGALYAWLSLLAITLLRRDARPLRTPPR